MTKRTNELLRLDLQFFAEDDEVETDKDADKETPPEPKVVTMTQEEFDAIIVREKGRVKGKFADYDDLKAKLAEFESAKTEQERAELSEIERLQADLAVKEEAAQTFATELETLRTQASQEKIRNAFAQHATANGIAYVDAALKLADLSSAKVDESGTVTGVEEVVKALVADNPFLVAKKEQKQIGDPSNGGKQDNEKTSEQLLEEAADKAKKSGRIEDRVAFDKLKRQLG